MEEKERNKTTNYNLRRKGKQVKTEKKSTAQSLSANKTG
jgi:hypothetical protein